MIESAPVTLRVLTINTHKGFTPLNRRFILPELRDAVRATEADVVFLQEVLGSHARHARRFSNWPLAPHYEFLADTMWPQYAYGRNSVYPHGHHGNALLSKFPIRSFENLDVSSGRDERRGLLHCQLEVPGQASEIHVVCVHLGLTEAHRRAQARLLCQRLQKAVPATAPLIVAGDFNDWRLHIDRMLRERSKLEEAFAATQGCVARTFPARFPVLRLDRVYVRNAAPVHARVLSTRPWSHLSDHAPLAVEVEL